MPDEALAHFREAMRARRASCEAEWDERFEAYARDASRRSATELELAIAGRAARRLGRGAAARSTPDDRHRWPPARRPSTVIQWAAAQVPELVGGSADLAALDADRRSRTAATSQPGDYAGRNIHFGVREHGMGAIVNGLDAARLRARSARTFLNFSDYMQGAVRLAALMKLPSIFVYTHDSIGLGEDGPTHQPIEQLAALRAMPQPQRACGPADANETALAWRFALDADRGARRRSRCRARALPMLEPGRRARRRDRARRLRALRRVLQGAGARRDPDRHRLRGRTLPSAPPTCSRPTGIATRVVSMPCLDRFAEQDEAYRDERAAAGGAARASRSRRPRRSAGTAGWATAATSSA